MHNKLAKFLEIQLKHSGLNVPMPHELMVKKARERLTPQGQSAFANVMIELKDLNFEDCHKMAILLLARYTRVFDLIDSVGETLREDAKDIIDFVQENPKYRQDPDEIKGDMFDELSSLFGED